MHSVNDFIHLCNQHYSGESADPIEGFPSCTLIHLGNSITLLVSYCTLLLHLCITMYMFTIKVVQGGGYLQELNILYSELSF